MKSPLQPYLWAAPGDVNAFFGLMLDNVAQLLLTVATLSAVFAFPTNFALRYMVPGTAIGVLVGDLLFFWLAFRLARQTGNRTVTAMPLGLDTPSVFGIVFFVLGPAFTAAKAAGLDEHAAAMRTWHIGICALFISGIFKFLCALISNQIRRLIPRAGLLGSLAAIALVLISFLPLLDALTAPMVGLVALAIILLTLIARVPLPFKMPGALGALLVAGTLHYVTKWLTGSGVLPEIFYVQPHELLTAEQASAALFPTEWLTVFRFEWLGALQETLQYLPVVIPFALGTIVGGIDCTESAAAAGDEYDTATVIGVESGATLIAALCGGVIQTTPYIGHPAYKAMGGRAAYTLATAIFIGSAGLIGYFAFLYLYIPRPTVFPILVFIGLEISSQSFLATPKRHYPAVAIACVPALALLASMFAGKVQGALFGPLGFMEVTNAIAANHELKVTLDTVRILSNGFIVTSVIWASALAAAIDRQLFRSSAFFAIAALLTLFGVMHSPMASGEMFWPWNLTGEPLKYVTQYASGYALVAILLAAWGGHLQFHGYDLKPLEEHH
ncbi:permease [Anatilimnocola floriformis]|uniref:permease n=1 Tax=Anatilimnocola floriformis TaxID=2948575 RepID=UPI0020C348CF|nr:permease [Anatilimnocola floriformis]